MSCFSTLPRHMHPLLRVLNGSWERPKQMQGSEVKASLVPWSRHCQHVLQQESWALLVRALPSNADPRKVLEGMSWKRVRREVLAHKEPEEGAHRRPRPHLSAHSRAHTMATVRRVFNYTAAQAPVEAWRVQPGCRILLPAALSFLWPVSLHNCFLYHPQMLISINVLLFFKTRVNLSCQSCLLSQMVSQSVTKLFGILILSEKKSYIFR